MEEKQMTLRIDAKCSDTCWSGIFNSDGKLLREKSGYVPNGLGIGGGDYVNLEIDLETGQILNWKKPTAEAVREFFEETY